MQNYQFTIGQALRARRARGASRLVVAGQALRVRRRGALRAVFWTAVNPDPPQALPLYCHNPRQFGCGSPVRQMYTYIHRGRYSIREV
jgi:hypothetical protein